MKRRNKILIAAAFVLVLGFVLLKPSGAYRRELEAYKKELRAKGEKLTVAELIPARTPDESNGAALFTKAMNAYTTPNTNPARMRMIGPGVAMVGHTNVGPALMINYAPNVVKMAELRTSLQASILDFNLNFSQGFALSLPHLPNLKKAAILASDTAIQAMYREDFEEARLDLLAAVDLVRIFRDEPITISDLVRIAMGDIAVRATWDALQSGHWTESQLAELQSRWEGVDFFATQETVFMMQRADAIETLAMFRKLKDGKALDQLILGGTSATSATRSGMIDFLREKTKELYDRYPRFWAWRSSWSYEEELFALQMNTAAIRVARRLKSAEAVVPAVNEFRREGSNIALLHPKANERFTVYPQTLFWIHEKHFMKVARAEVSRRLLVTAIALRRYDLSHNSYPPNLDGLVPVFLQRIPIDPMDGKPLRYRLNPDGSFLLFSVGEDGEDNGGNAAPTGTTNLSNWVYARDAVWPRAATPEEVEQFNQTQKKATNGPGNDVQIRE